MKTLTKKRLKASIIDSIISSTVLYGTTYMLRKKIKSKTFHEVISPAIVSWGLEYIQLRKSGQTIGYKLMGLKLENSEGNIPSNKEIIKRLIHRDTIAPILYIKNKEAFEGENGATFPHDKFSNTVVKEVNK